MSDLDPQPGETLDRLSRSLRLLQRVRGHRATSDDVILAGLAARYAPRARRILDLGSGKGTVALLLARRLPHSRIIGVEAVAESHALAIRNARLNGLSDRYEARLADLRDPEVLRGEPPFDLICGAPPFMRPGTGVLPTDPQRAAGRFELRGGVEDYVAAAASRQGGTVVMLVDGTGGPRLELAFARAGLGMTHLITVVPRPGRPATYCIGIAGAGPGRPDTTLPMRGPAGDAWSPAYAELRAELELDA